MALVVDYTSNGNGLQLNPRLLLDRARRNRFGSAIRRETRPDWALPTRPVRYVLRSRTPIGCGIYTPRCKEIPPLLVDRSSIGPPAPTLPSMRFFVMSPRTSNSERTEEPDVRAETAKLALDGSLTPMEPLVVEARTSFLSPAGS